MSPAPRRCPRCAARMAAEQDWCLECGAAATTRIVAPPDWRLAVAIVVAVVAAAAVTVAIVVSSLGGDSNDAVAGAPAATPATTPAAKHRPRTRRRAAAAPVTGTATTATAPTAPTTSTLPGSAAAGVQAVPLWPSTKQAYTVVALTTPDRKAAEQRARQLIAKGRDAGILRSDKYDFFSPGAWVVYVGQFKDKAAAQAQLPKLSADAPSGYVTFVRSRH